MTITDDGDIVRGLGYVTLYAAYMEEAIDECVNVFVAHDPAPPKNIDRFKISQRITYVRERVFDAHVFPNELSRFPQLLDQIGVLLELRNEVVHGRIYGGHQGAYDVLRPGRPSGTARSISSGELYDLANAMFDLLSPLNHASWYSIPRFLK